MRNSKRLEGLAVGESKQDEGPRGRLRRRPPCSVEGPSRSPAGSHRNRRGVCGQLSLVLLPAVIVDTLTRDDSECASSREWRTQVAAAEPLRLRLRPRSRAKSTLLENEPRNSAVAVAALLGLPVSADARPVARIDASA